MKKSKNKNEAVSEAVAEASEEASVGIGETPAKPKRNVATKLYVHYQESDADGGGRNLTAFDYKEQLDAWLSEKSTVKVLSIIRGVEKKIKTQTKVTLL